MPHCTVKLAERPLLCCFVYGVPAAAFYNGASTIVILVIMMGQCMLPDRASDNDDSNDYTQSDGLYRF